jgi:hypothetical protein
MRNVGTVLFLVLLRLPAIPSGTRKNVWILLRLVLKTRGRPPTAWGIVGLILDDTFSTIP